jgi:hypothetical protein
VTCGTRTGEAGRDGMEMHQIVKNVQCSMTGLSTQHSGDMRPDNHLRKMVEEEHEDACFRTCRCSVYICVIFPLVFKKVCTWARPWLAFYECFLLIHATFSSTSCSESTHPPLPIRGPQAPLSRERQTNTLRPLTRAVGGFLLLLLRISTQMADVGAQSLCSSTRMARWMSSCLRLGDRAR